MVTEIPEYCLRAYALFFSKYGTKTPFKQSVLDWIVGESMKKKIFSMLMHAGWIEKKTREQYVCKNPKTVVHALLDFKVPTIMKKAERPYAFTGLSAVEIWSDFCYVQRSREKSPYFIKIEKKDIPYWKTFFSKQNVFYYFEKGSIVGEYVILIPVEKVIFVEKEGIKVESMKETIQFAEQNEMYQYPLEYMKKKYGEKDESH